MKVNQLREGLFLENDVIRYVCDVTYTFHKGSDGDYVHKCQEGGWNSTDVPTCVTGKCVLPSITFMFFLCSKFEISVTN